MIEATSESMVVEKVIDYVKKLLINEKTGHDWFHNYRTWRLANYLQSKEGGDSEIIQLGALLHGISEREYKNIGNEDFRCLAMHGFLDVLEITGEKREKIIEIVNNTEYRGNETVPARTLEGRIVQDANWLDGIGAIGISRVFTSGGFLGRTIYDPSRKPESQKITKKKYLQLRKESTSYNYFFEKSFQLEKCLNTQTAKKIAAERIKCMKSFLDHFKKEWNMEDFTG